MIPATKMTTGSRATETKKRKQVQSKLENIQSAASAVKEQSSTQHRENLSKPKFEMLAVKKFR